MFGKSPVKGLKHAVAVEKIFKKLVFLVFAQSDDAAMEDEAC